MRSTTSLVAICLVAGGALSAADVLTPQLSKAFENKIAIVQRHEAQSQAQARSRIPRSTSFSEPELNSYLRFDATDLLPTGLTDPSISLVGNGRVTGRAVVDLDIVRQKQSSGSWFDPATYLTGRLPVSATGIIISGEGQGRFAFERVEVNGVEVPKVLLAQIVNYFTRTEENPRGSSIDDTFELPAQIQRISVDAGRFSVLQ